jgi:hypothetical protein
MGRMRKAGTHTKKQTRGHRLSFLVVFTKRDSTAIVFLQRGESALEVRRIFRTKLELGFGHWKRRRKLQRRKKRWKEAKQTQMRKEAKRKGP